MKKFSYAVLVSVLMLSAANAYNPPVYGDDVFELSSPRQLTNSSSVVGGGLFYASPESMIANPALSAREQRVDLNLAYTGLISSDESNDKRYGNAFQLGCLCLMSQNQILILRTSLLFSILFLDWLKQKIFLLLLILTIQRMP